MEKHERKGAKGIGKRSRGESLKGHRGGNNQSVVLPSRKLGLRTGGGF